MGVGKFNIVNGAEVDLSKGLVVLTLDCGHILRQRRSPSHLKKPHFKTLETAQGRPFRAHCNICKKQPGADSVQETLDWLVSKLTEAESRFDGLFEGMAQMFIDPDADTRKLVDAKDNVIHIKNLIADARLRLDEVSMDIKGAFDD
jgi:hypothetical protein